MPVRIPIYQAKLSNSAEAAIDGIDYPSVPGIETVSGILRVPLQEAGKGRIVRVAIMPVGTAPEPRPNDCEWMVPDIGTLWLPNYDNTWTLTESGDLTNNQADETVYREIVSAAPASGDFTWIIEVEPDYGSLVMADGGGLFIRAAEDNGLFFYVSMMEIWDDGLGDYADVLHIIVAWPERWFREVEIPLPGYDWTSEETIFLKAERTGTDITLSYAIGPGPLAASTEIPGTWTSAGTFAQAGTEIGLFTNIYYQNYMHFRLWSLTPCPPGE